MKSFYHKRMKFDVVSDDLNVCIIMCRYDLVFLFEYIHQILLIRKMRHNSPENHIEIKLDTD